MSDEEVRTLAAIMFTDMVGYSALSQRDDKLALDLLEEHRQLLRAIFPRLVEFKSALKAAQCAIEIQRGLAKRNADVPPDRRIELKIGVHIGDVVHRGGGDVYGDGVNIASRIEPLAGANGICVSMDVERQIRNAIETRLEKVAPTELKNISVPMELFRIVLPWERQPMRATAAATASPAHARAWLWPAAPAAFQLLIGIGWWWTTLPHRTALVPNGPAHRSVANSAGVLEKSIAVLPLVNSTGILLASVSGRWHCLSSRRRPWRLSLERGLAPSRLFSFLSFESSFFSEAYYSFVFWFGCWVSVAPKNNRRPPRIGPGSVERLATVAAAARARSRGVGTVFLPDAALGVFLGARSCTFTPAFFSVVRVVSFF